MMAAIALRLSRAALALASLGLAGCMMYPYDGEQVNSHTGPVQFRAYVTDPTTSIMIQCPNLNVYPVGGGYTYETVTTLTYAGGSYTVNGQTVYPEQALVALPPDCWQDKYAGRSGSLRDWFAIIDPSLMTPSGPSGVGVAVYDSAGLSCLGANISEGPITAGQQCELTRSGSPVHEVTIYSAY